MVVRKEWWEWEYHLNQVLLTKPAEVMQESCQVLKKHGCRVEVELKSELYCGDKVLNHKHECDTHAVLEC